MDTNDAAACFSALSQETRLAVFRLLVGAPPEGVSAGDIARRIGVPHNTMSTHLGILVRAGLVTSHREGRSIRYAADNAGIRALVGFMLEDCCQGRPDLCAPHLAGDTACCAPAALNHEPAGTARRPRKESR